jgi:hypothetical protein
MGGHVWGKYSILNRISMVFPQTLRLTTFEVCREGGMLLTLIHEL